MKRLFLLVLFLVIVLGQLYSQDQDNALSSYKPIYIVSGFTDTDQVKVQTSFKYDLFYPYHLGLYIAYTQIMFWDLWSYSGPFNEINYSPEAFYRFESGHNFLGDISIMFVDYLQLGVDHVSNGEDVPDSRGYSSFYLQGQFSANLGTNFVAGLNCKYFWPFDYDGNSTSDIQDYIGSFSTKIFFKLVDHQKGIDLEEIYFHFGFGGGPNGMDVDMGWQEIGLKSRAFFSRFRPFIYIYNGYAESISMYNSDTSGEPLGISFKIGTIIE